MSLPKLPRTLPPKPKPIHVPETVSWVNPIANVKPVNKQEIEARRKTLQAASIARVKARGAAWEAKHPKK